MTRKQSPTSEESLAKLQDLLTDFQQAVASHDLRTRVRALVPVHETLLQLDQTLISRELATSARDRLLYYFQEYPLTVLKREELLIVAGIGEWARRVRELRVEFGWPILSGLTVRQMLAEGDFPVIHTSVTAMHADDYIMISTEQDRDAAYRWGTARDIRNAKLPVRDKLLQYLRKNVGKNVTGEELKYVAKDKTEWARRVRELRTDHGWPIATKQTGRPDLAMGVYVLELDSQNPELDSYG